MIVLFVRRLIYTRIPKTNKNLIRCKVMKSCLLGVYIANAMR